MTGDSAIRQRSRKVRATRRAQAGSAEKDSADHALRKTGIRVMGDMPWAAHLCVFFETKEDLLDTVATYFAAGLASNELCVWAISDPITEEDAKKVLRRVIPDFDQHLAQNHQGLEREAQRRLGQGLRGYEGQRQCVLVRIETLEGVLRVRA